MIDAAFGESAPWSVGVEEEIMLLDAETLALAPAAGELVAEGTGGVPGALKTELFASILELTTCVCSSAGEAVEHLGALRERAGALARRRGLAIAATGAHPFSRPEDQVVVEEPRYVEFVRYAGITARRQGVSGLHVHIGMPSAAGCFHALESVLPWLPLVLALSANSPYLGGEETGLASTRAELLALLPRSGAPPAFPSYAAWEAYVEQLVRVGLISDYTSCWWDARPHPRFGTLEIRMPDQPTSLARTGALVALVQALCVTVLREPARPYDPGRRGLYQQNRWVALRFGPRAELVHPHEERLAGVPELAAELLAFVAPAAGELGTSGLLAALDPQVCEGDRQLEIGREHGLKAVCSDVVARTLRSS